MKIDNALAAYSREYASSPTVTTPQEISEGKALSVSKEVVANQEIDISRKAMIFVNKGQEVMSRYNIEHASPREIADMSLELYEGNVISFEEHSRLSFQTELHREQYQEMYGEAPQPDNPRDYIVEWQNKLDSQRASGTPREFTLKTVDMIGLLNNLQSLVPVGDEGLKEG